MKPDLRIAHASDIHLDTDYYGGPENLESRDYCRKVFRDLLDRIVAHEPQLMLLPGDLFDSNRASADTIAWALEQFAALPFPLAMIPGNHDCLEEGAIYLRHDFGQAGKMRMLLAPDGETLELPELGAAVWGRGMIAHHPDFVPLASLPAPRPDRWNLGMGHGIYVGTAGNGYRSSPIRASEIAKSGYDYLALGHHHALLDVTQGETAAYFSGAPIPITRGGRGTYLMISLTEVRPARVEIHRLD